MRQKARSLSVHSRILYGVFACAFLYIYAFRLKPSYNFHDPDTFWHLALGKWMIQHEKIVTTSIHSFLSELDYVAHEVLFQLIIASIHNSFGWAGLHAFNVFCLGLMIIGMYQLSFAAMKEFHIKELHPAVHLMLLINTAMIYQGYMAIRPQMISGPLILFFFVLLLQFRMNPTIKKGVMFGLLSLLIANFHGGVWPIIAVLWGLGLLEIMVEKKRLPKVYIAGSFSILAGGIINVGGWKTITYVLLILNDSLARSINTEWQPVKLLEDKPFLFLFCILIYGVIRMKRKKLFHVLFSMAVLVLAIVSYKHAFYAFLFLPYFLSAGAVNIPNAVLKIKHQYIYVFITLSLSLFLLLGMVKPYEQPYEKYPVDEMNFILKEKTTNTRLKVLTDFTASAYVHYRGADILADGRWDPFISKESVQGSYQLNQIERTKYIFQDGKMEILKEELLISKPDYLIYPLKEKNPFMKETIEEITALLGPPAYQGRYGYVWKGVN